VLYTLVCELWLILKQKIDCLARQPSAKPAPLPTKKMPGLQPQENNKRAEFYHCILVLVAMFTCYVLIAQSAWFTRAGIINMQSPLVGRCRSIQNFSASALTMSFYKCVGGCNRRLLVGPHVYRHKLTGTDYHGFLSAFTVLRKATISFVIAARLSARME